MGESPATMVDEFNAFFANPVKLGDLSWFGVAALGMRDELLARIAALEAERDAITRELGRKNDRNREWRQRAEQAEAALDELDSYNGHLAWMDKHYPLDVPYFAEGEDVGCQVMRLSRKVMELERMLRLSFEDAYPMHGDTYDSGGIYKRWLADLRARAEEDS